MSTVARPADKLLGLELPNGWKVKKRLPKDPNSTGGHFSSSYIVEHPDKADAFLKALDYSEAFGSPNVAQALLDLTQAIVFERNLCTACSQQSLEHIVLALDQGTVVVDPTSPLGKVEYIVFELAN